MTVVSAFTMTVQGPVPLQPPPLKPAKVEPGSAAAVRVTEVLLLNEAWQGAPQLTPAGLLVTVPSPDPVLATVRVKVENPVPVKILVDPPAPVKVTFPMKAPAEVGLKRTVTV